MMVRSFTGMNRNGAELREWTTGMDLNMCPFFQGVLDSSILVLCQGQPCIDLLYAEKSTCTDISANCEKKIYLIIIIVKNISAKILHDSVVNGN